MADLERQVIFKKQKHETKIRKKKSTTTNKRYKYIIIVYALQNITQVSTPYHIKVL